MAINKTVLNRIFRQSGQDFEVDTIELRNPFTGQPIGTKLLYRKDNKVALKVGVSDAFEPFQNSDVKECLVNLAENVHITPLSMGIFDEGRVSYTIFNIGRASDKQFHIENGNFSTYVEKRFALFHHHDGRAGIFIIPIPYEYESQSYFSGLNMKNPHFSSSIITFRHSRDLNSKLSTIASNPSPLISTYTHIEALYNKLISTNVSMDYAIDVLMDEFPVLNVSTKKGTVSINALKNLVDILENLNSSYYIKYNEDLVVNKWILYNSVHKIHQFFPLRASANEENHYYSTLSGNVRDNSQNFLDIMMTKTGGDGYLTTPQLVEQLKGIIDG